MQLNLDTVPFHMVGIPRTVADVSGRPGVFGLSVQGDCMNPEIHDGDLIVVDPNEKPEPGDNVVVWQTRGGPIIKQWLGMNGPYYELRQLNPPRRYSILDANVAEIHKIFAVVPRERCVPAGGDWS